MIALQKQIFWAGRIRKGLTGVAVAAVGGFAVVCYLPDRAQLAVLREQTDQTLEQIRKNEAAAKDLSAIKSDVARLRDQITRSRQLPQQQDLSRFIIDLTSLSNANALQKFLYEPGIKRQQELCSELPISLKFEGTFTNVAGFLQQLEELPRMTRTRQLQVRCRDGIAGAVDVQMVVSVFAGEGQ